MCTCGILRLLVYTVLSLTGNLTLITAAKLRYNLFILKLLSKMFEATRLAFFFFFFFWGGGGRRVIHGSYLYIYLVL